MVWEMEKSLKSDLSLKILSPANAEKVAFLSLMYSLMVDHA